MMERPKSSPRGTQDLFFEKSDLFSQIEKKSQEIFDLSGFREIKTPIFENTEIFQRAAGESSDLVGKEMYTFLDRSERSITLRPEGTAGVVRALLSNGLDRAPRPLKLWYKGPMFRYERSQAGRYRQFHQLGLEVFGSQSKQIELESINLACDLLKKLEIYDFKVEINTLGEKSTRKKYLLALRSFLQKNENKLCKDCQKRIETNPLRALDCKVEEDQILYQEKAPRIYEYLNSTEQEKFQELIRLLKDLKIDFEHNQFLVRGLDYYNQTVFEIKVPDLELGSQNTLCAGGRYDHLVQEFGGPSLSAFGWAFGLERLILLLEKKKTSQNSESFIFDYFVVNEKKNFLDTYRLVQKLRSRNLKVSLDYDQKNINKQIQLAKKQRARKIIFYTGDLENYQEKDLRSDYRN